MLLRTADSDEKRDEIVSTVTRPPVAATGGSLDEDLPEWAEDYMPSWWGGHEQAEFDATRGGSVTATK